jgi:glycosyltransferase involved in cell wall biosynthesis
VRHSAVLPRVLQLIAPAPFGGAESVVASLAAAWRHAGGDGGVAALMAHPEAGRFTDRLRAEGVPVHEIHGGTRGYAHEIRVVADLLHELRVELLHTHVYRADAVGFLAARRVGVPVVATVHGFTGGDLKNRFYQWFDRRLLRRFDAVSCVSPALMQRLLASGVRAEILRHLPNALVGTRFLERHEARRALGLPLEGVLIGWVGRLSTEKAPERFVGALSRMRHRCTGVVVGDGPLRVMVERAAAESHGRVRVLGPRENAGSLLSAFDLLALTSRTEGTPMVLLEAMQAGVPIVAAAVGGVPALLGATARMVSDGDEGGFAAVMDAVLDDPEDTAARVRAARARAESDFGAAGWVRAHADLYALARR